jgi:ubiquinone/menaquinone biosynthesis C-methylase UbiE
MPRHVRDAVRKEYTRLAPEYDGRWTRYVRRSTARTLRHLGLGPGQALADLGCGTGALLDAVAAVLDSGSIRMIGLDVTPPMLAHARRRLPASVPLLAGDAGALPLKNATFDTVVSVSTFHYWPDPAAALAEIRRVLRPGGRLVITDWCDDFLGCRLLDRWLRLTRRTYHRIYGSGEIGGLLTRAGFHVNDLEHYKVTWLWGLMTLAATVRD